MPRKSNKTSYVMNLITNGEEEQGQEGQSGQDSQKEQGEQTAQVGGQNTLAAQPAVPGATPEAETKKIVVVDEDQESERLSEEIKGQLELQLEAELKEQADAESEAEQTPGQPVQETETVEQKPTESVNAAADAGYTAPSDTAATKTEIVEPTMDTEMNTVPETENINMAAEPTAAEPAAAAPESAAAEPAAAENTNTTAEQAAVTETVQPPASTENSNTATQPTQPSQPGYRMVNVMETLVARVNLDKYIKEYDVCPCPRCRADVHALILTSLPSKYVVMDENAISVMLNYYESRRKTDIFTATLKACLEVKEHPRHDEAAEK